MNIIELAKEAGVIPHETNIAYMQGDFPQRLERFAAIVREEREWVDLTDDEIEQAVLSVNSVMEAWVTYHAVIAAFKEKNK